MGAVLEIGHSKRASSTPAAAMIAEGWFRLADSGLTYQDLGAPGVLDSDEVIHAVGGDADIVGVLVFRPDVVRGVAIITLAYVEPSSRRQGVFSAMMARLADRCREVGIVRVMFETHVKNKLMQAVMDSMEIEPTMLTYDLRVDPEPANGGG